MPWLWILVLVGGIYVVVKIVQGVRDLIAWLREGREFAEELKKSNARRQEARRGKAAGPVFKERPDRKR